MTAFSNKQISASAGSNYPGKTTMDFSINIRIGAEDVNEVIRFIINGNIPFSMTSVPSLTQSKPMDAEPVRINNESVSVQKSSIEIIYDEYIIGRIEGSAPKMDEIVEAYGVSKYILIEDFKERYGKPFYQIYLDKKMEHAARLLEQGLPASAVSRRIGYSHPIKFNKMFQKYFGTTPKKYQLSLV